MMDMATFGGFDPDSEPKRYRYDLLAEFLARLIEDGAIEPNMALPAEPEFAAVLGVSLGTARRATRVLRERGLVITVKSKGTFVLPPGERVSGAQ